MKKANYERTADNAIYLEENRYDKVKEQFKQIADILKLDKVKRSREFSMIDIGGATGEFLYYIRTLQPDMTLLVAEYSSDLVDAGNINLLKHKIPFIKADANNLESVQSDSFDYVTTIGVTSIFDDFRPSFSEMIRIARNNAVCLNSMMVNEYGVDVIIKYINPSTGKPESGWNKFSLKSIEEFLRNHPMVSGYRFEKHIMPFDLPQRDDLMRSWTKINECGERILWNGLNMEIAIYNIIFEVRK